MPSLVMPLLVILALLAALRTAQASHHTCTWGGPGDDPYKGNYTLYCTGVKVNEDEFTADYNCQWDDGHDTLVATYGKLDGEYGIIEFCTPCNSKGFAPKGVCGPSFWGLCLGERSNTTGDYNQCRYMQYYDDCEWQYVITNTEKPTKVSVFRKNYRSFVEEGTAKE